MSFVAVPPSPQSPANAVVTAGEWWPVIDCNEVRDSLRLSDIVTHQRLLDEIRGALITVTGDLASWRAAREAQGFEALSAIDADHQIDGLTQLELLFVRAVRFAAAATLAELHRGVGSTNEALTRADAEIQTAADYRRLSLQAVRDILGTTRVAVELI